MIRPSRCASSWREPNDPLTWIATAASGRSIEKLATLLTTRRDTSPVRNAPNSRCRSRTVVAPVINGASRCSASSASWSRYWPITSTWSSACLATRRSVTRFLPDAVAASRYLSSRSAVAYVRRSASGLQVGGHPEHGRRQQVHLVVDHQAPVARVEQLQVGVDALPAGGEHLVGRDGDRPDLLAGAGVLPDLGGSEGGPAQQLVPPPVSYTHL